MDNSGQYPIVTFNIICQNRPSYELTPYNKYTKNMSDLFTLYSLLLQF